MNGIVRIKDMETLTSFITNLFYNGGKSTPLHFEVVWDGYEFVVTLNYGK